MGAMRGAAQRAVLMIGAATLVAGCVGTPSDLAGGWGAPSLSALQQMCGAQNVDYGSDAQPVYSTLFDAYVASRHGGLSKEGFCSFQTTLAQQYTTLGATGDPATRNRWVAFFLDQRVKALSWRAAVDSTLRSG